MSRPRVIVIAALGLQIVGLALSAAQLWWSVVPQALAVAATAGALVLASRGRREVQTHLERVLAQAAGYEHAALTDALTGVPNRRAFDRALEAAAEDGRPFAIALVDINDFKPVNDAHGHAAGDDLLRSCVAAWRSELRGSDVLARIGGDEFAVLLPDCADREARRLRERLTVVVPHEPACAVGVAVWDGIEAPQELVRRADRELYTAKARMSAERLHDPVRLGALAATGLMDREPDEELQALARSVADLLDAPLALVTLVDDYRQFFAARFGEVPSWATLGTPLTHSFCRHAVVTGRPLVVEDAGVHPLVADNPAVDELAVSAYAGIPIVDGDGQRLGALCAIDHQPRAWSHDDLVVLRRLATQAAGRIARVGRP